MNGILKIFANDVKSVSKHFFALAIIVAISVLPALYAWVNIYANGNPYVNTGNIKIAVASNDPGLDLKDGRHVNMADEVLESLKDSKSIDWQFPDTPDEAIAGVESGEYYAAIIFEDNFTYNMYNFEQALLDDKEPLTYYENAKKNAVASKITETAASTLQENINTKYLQTVFSIVFEDTNELSDELDSGETADQVIDELRQLQTTLDSYANSIASFTSNSGAVQNQIIQTESNLSASRKRNQKSIANASSDLKSARSSVRSLRNASDYYLSRLDKRLDKLEKALTAIDGVNPTTPEELEKAKTQSARLLDTLEKMRAMLPTDGSIDGSASIIAGIDSMKQNVQAIKQTLDSTPERAQDMLAAIDAMRVISNTVVRPGFDAMIVSLESTIDMLGPFVGTVSNMMDDINPLLDATSSTVDSMDNALGQLQKVFESASDRITDIIAKVEVAEEDDKVALLIDLLGGDSNMYAKFFSSLVDVDVQEIYQVASYGAAMSPFYSVLAIWVGGVILVSILKTDVDRKKFPDLSESQYFFGRFLIFFVIGQIQAAVIVAGDIYLLNCAPVHPVLMWLAAAVTSLVFVMLIYALTLSFGDIGKAIVVIVMVIQIAGSSGSYPIEILPELFSKIYKFFPFPYAINAMREALCGLYKYDYVIYLAELLIFLVLGLVIGLFVRKPFIGMNRFVSEKIEETEVL